MLATGRSVVGLATTNLQAGYAASKWRLSAAITPLDSFIVSGHARFSDMLMHAGKAHTVPRAVLTCEDVFVRAAQPWTLDFARADAESRRSTRAMIKTAQAGCK